MGRSLQSYDFTPMDGDCCPRSILQQQTLNGIQNSRPKFKLTLADEAICQVHDDKVLELRCTCVGIMKTSPQFMAKLAADFDVLQSMQAGMGVTVKDLHTYLKMCLPLASKRGELPARALCGIAGWGGARRGTTGHAHAGVGPGGAGSGGRGGVGWAGDTVPGTVGGGSHRPRGHVKAQLRVPPSGTGMLGGQRRYEQDAMGKTSQGRRPGIYCLTAQRRHSLCISHCVH